MTRRGRAGPFSDGGTGSSTLRFLERASHGSSRLLYQALTAWRSAGASGRAVAAGDVNGDGIDDLIIGAFGADPGEREGAGETYVIFGEDEPVPMPARTSTPIATATPTPTTAGARGDANEDGVVSAIDAALILQLDVGLVGSLPGEALADVNDDGCIDAVDAALVLQFVAGLLSEL